MQVAPLKQGCFGIVHCLTVFSPEWEMYWHSLLDNFGSCAGDSAATRVSWTGPQLFQMFSVHTSIQSPRWCCQRSIASLVGPILKYISMENIQIYMEKLYFMMMTMPRSRITIIIYFSKLDYILSYVMIFLLENWAPLFVRLGPPVMRRRMLLFRKRNQIHIRGAT